MKRWVCFIPTLLLFASCKTTAPPYASNYPLSPERFISRDGVLQGRVPEGWFSSMDDTLAPALVVWLVKEDYSAVMAIRKISADNRTKHQIEKEGLNLLAQISFSFEKEHSKDVIYRATPTDFSLNGNKFSSYEITDGELTKRVVVFERKGNFYACEAFPTKGTWSQTELSALFVIQQTVLSSFSSPSSD